MSEAMVQLYCAAYLSWFASSIYIDDRNPKHNPKPTKKSWEDSEEVDIGKRDTKNPKHNQEKKTEKHGTYLSFG